jgi:membrane protease YdiL (CAAX protease family)
MWCVSIAFEPLAELLPGDQSSLGGGGWLIVSAVFLAPLFEEIIFRGYIAGMLKTSYGGVAAWLLSSILFGAVHAIPSVMLTATFSGLVLGFYFLRYRSLMMVMMLHAMNNLTACFLKTIELDQMSIREIIANDTIYWVVYGVSSLVAFVALWRMVVVVSRIKSDNIQ